MEKKHTQEPWSVSPLGTYIHDWSVVLCRLFDQDGDDYENHEANARRIVACVNACAGIPTFYLEEKGLPSVDEHLGIEKQRDDLQRELAQVKAAMKAQADGLVKQRDEALAALRVVASISHCGGLAKMSESDAITAIRRATIDYFDSEATEEQHRSAIARVKGGAA